jgi:hypothetical protein
MLTYKHYDIKKGLTRTKTRLAVAFSGAALVLGGGAMSLASIATTHAAGPTVVVHPGNTQWSTADTRPGGAVSFINDPGSPAPTGALQLTTDASTTSKAQYLHDANTALANVTELSYQTKQVSGPAFADPSYQFLVDLNGSAAGGFTTFVYEPYENGVVTPGSWQSWDVDAGQFWSSRTFTDGTCAVVAGGGGAPFYTLAQLKTDCPSAVAVGFGVNIGSNNPSYNVETDLVNFNGTTYDFEATASTTAAPSITSPANNATITTAQLNKVDWTDSTGAVTYQYRAFSDPAYTASVYDSGPTLTSSEIPTPGTPPGEYYVQVRAFDSDGNVSAWSNDATNPYHFTVVPVVSLANKDACKNNGWKTSNTPVFKNQGDCVSYFATGGRNPANG